MLPVSDIELVSLLLGALDPSRRRALAERVAADPALQTRLAALSETRAAPGEPSLWLPPPARWRGHLRAQVRVEATLSEPERVAPGGLVMAEITLPDDAAARWLLVLREEADGWTVISPEEPAELRPLSELPARDGRLPVGLSVTVPEGPQRWTLALPPLSMAPDWTLPETTRWSALQRSLAQGELPALSVSVQVG